MTFTAKDWSIVDELSAAKARIRRLESALGKIASCEKKADGDVVDIARAALITDIASKADGA